MRYYGNRALDRVKDIIDAEVSEGVRSLRASNLARTYSLEPRIVQQVLSDLSATHDLKAIYLLLCSGEHQNFDPDREFERVEDIPSHTIRCSKCGDAYTPDSANILVSFEPTEQYLESLSEGRTR